MPENPGGIAPLRWRELVGEALRRRNAERLTQRQHAALANVSVPTLAAFERGETTLTLAKIFDILRVVGLVEEPSENGGQDVFVRESFARWRSLTERLPEDSPGRFPHGWYRFDYCLEGAIKSVDLPMFEADLKDVASKSRASWPTFRVPKQPRQPELATHKADGLIECWFPPGGDGIERVFSTSAHCDFWRAAPIGRLFLIRGYREDGQETFPPGTILDTILPIRELADVLSHAGRLAEHLRKRGGNPLTVRFRAQYMGLSGRILRPWADPLGEFFDRGHAPHSNEAILQVVAGAEDIQNDLAKVVFPLVLSLYERFGVTKLSMSRVRAEIARLMG